MHPELFEIPFIHATVKSYGLMIVIGILATIFVIRKLSDRIGQASVNKDYITNGALYALIAGVIGSRIFYIVHHYNQFRGDFISVFSIWKGGLELLGGVVLAISVIFAYLLVLKLPVRRYLDILAIGIVLTLACGRIGCLMNGCCYGKPTDAAWGVRFPYGSLSYWSQVHPDPDRGRSQPYIELPSKYFGTVSEDGTWIEADPAYKNVDVVADVSDQVGIATKVARLVPLSVVKG
jgi:phosphatidylglycerol:prolipoprotein diacylglycerol transferase